MLEHFRAGTVFGMGISAFVSGVVFLSWYFLIFGALMTAASYTWIIWRKL